MPTKDAEDKEMFSAVRALLRKVGGVGAEKMPRDPPLTDVFVSQIQPQDANNLLKLLADILPLADGLSHLRRVRKLASSSSPKGFILEIVLCREEAWRLRSDDIDTQLSKFNLQPRVEKLPAVAPLCTEELEIWKKLWPLVYKPGKETYTPPTSKQLLQMYKHATYVQGKADRVNECHYPVVAILVHPASNAIVCEASDTSYRAQSGTNAKIAANTCLSHAVMNLVSTFAIPHAQHAAMRKYENNNETSLSLLGEDQYLCTGLDCYVTREPCVMCAMALLHSRIRRVVFLKYNEKEVGGIVTAKMHCEPALNHRFEAFYLPVQSIDNSVSRITHSLSKTESASQ